MTGPQMRPNFDHASARRAMLIAAIDADQARAVVAEILGVLNSAVDVDGPAAAHLLDRVAERVFPIERALLDAQASPGLLDPMYTDFWSSIAGDDPAGIPA